MVKSNKMWFLEVCFYVKDSFDVVIVNTTILLTSKHK